MNLIATVLPMGGFLQAAIARAPQTFWGVMGGIGALCGWQGVFTAVIMASFFGSVYGVSLLLMKRADRMSHMPFGPFLALSGLWALLFGPDHFLQWIGL